MCTSGGHWAARLRLESGEEAHDFMFRRVNNLHLKTCLGSGHVLNCLKGLLS